MARMMLTHKFIEGLRLLFMAVLLAALAFSLMLVSVAQAGPTEVVTNLNDSGGGSLRQAIAVVDDGGEITFSVTGPITLTTGELEIDKNLTITGPGAGSLTIDGDGNSRVFDIASGKTVTISGVTITGGYYSQYGGGIYNYYSTLTLNDCTVSGNSAGASGGGICNFNGTLTLNNSTVSDNTTGSGGYGGEGGGISNYSWNGGILTLNNSTVSGNSTGSGGYGSDYGADGGWGGGIYNEGTVTLTNSTVSGNSVGSGGEGGYYGGSGGWGGGIFNFDTVTLTNSTVSGNSTGDGGPGGYGGGDGGLGGGIRNGGILTLTNSTVSGNSTGSGGAGAWESGDGGWGGGILNTGTLTLTNSTVSGNSTGDGGPGGWEGGDGGWGGGMSNYDTVTLTNSTVSGNTTGSGGYGTLAGMGGSGGGIVHVGTTLTLNNSTVSGNATGSNGPGFTGGGYGGGIRNQVGTVISRNNIIADNTVPFGALGPDLSGTLTSQGCNLIESPPDSDWDYAPGSDTTGDITGQDPMLDPLADNGGPTQTHSLQTGSPAIDAVLGGYCTTVDGDPVNTDQRGEPRPMDGDSNGSLLCDIGAYEAPGPTPPEPPPPVPVGGELYPVNKLSILAPWLTLALFLAMGGGILVVRQSQAS